MSGLKVVIVLFACANDLLLCRQIPSDHLAWTYTEACRAELPAIVRRHLGRDERYPIVVGKCRIVLAEGEGASAPLAADRRQGAKPPS